jgi:hypothetical protein
VAVTGICRHSDPEDDIIENLVRQPFAEMGMPAPSFVSARRTALLGAAAADPALDGIESQQ